MVQSATNIWLRAICSRLRARSHVASAPLSLPTTAFVPARLRPRLLARRLQPPPCPPASGLGSSPTARSRLRPCPPPTTSRQLRPRRPPLASAPRPPSALPPRPLAAASAQRERERARGGGGWQKERKKCEDKWAPPVFICFFLTVSARVYHVS